jgi:radical SAM enzyme (TIGR01210 family)
MACFDYCNSADICYIKRILVRKMTLTIDTLIQQGLQNLRTTPGADVQERMRRVYRTISQQAQPIVSEPVIVHWVGGQPLVWFPLGCHKFETVGGCGPCDGYGKYHGYMTPEGKARELPAAIRRGLHELRLFGESQIQTGRTECAFNIGAADTFRDCAFPSEQRRQLYQEVAQLITEFQERGLHASFLFETRLEQITERKLQELRDAVPQAIPISIGVGIEAADAFIRETLINKCYGSQAVQLLQQKVALAKRYAVDIEGHSLLGTPGLTELDALASAVETTLAIHDAGSTQVILMTANLKTGDSLATRLSHRGLYTLPSIHATVEALRYCTEQRQGIRILPFGFAAAVPTLQYAQGCDACTSRIKEGLDTYARICNIQGPAHATTYLREHYDTTFSCTCKNAWVDGLRRDAGSRLQERIDSFVATACRVIA